MILFVTDIDDTIVPSLGIPDRSEDKDVKSLKDYLRGEFADSGGLMAVSTGRNKDMSDRDKILFGDHPFPVRYAIYNVGTEIWKSAGKSWELMEDYENHLVSSGFNPKTVYPLFNGISGIWQQEQERDSKFKASFYANPGIKPEKLQELVTNALEGYPCQLAISTQHGPGPYFIDVTPVNSGKGKAMQFLTRKLVNEGYPFRAAAAAGDSGNDITLFDPGEFEKNTGLKLIGILPSNAREELTIHTRNLERSGFPIFHTSKPRAAGVLEGLKKAANLPRIL